MADTDLTARLVDAIDQDSPVPVYHQLAAVVRWEIAAGRLPIGADLPPIRVIAGAVGLNYHTVRRGWEDLASEGILSLRRGRGARVVRAPVDPIGWSAASGSAPAGEIPRAWVVLPSLERAARLASRLAGRWEVAAVPYPAPAPPPPPGPILSTLPLTDRWSREADLHRMELALEPDTIAAVRRNAALLGVSRVNLVATGDDDGPILADLLRQLPRVGVPAGRTERPELVDGVLNACLPVAHDRLDWVTRNDPRVMAIELDWAAGPVARVATRLGWERVRGDGETGDR